MINATDYVQALRPLITARQTRFRRTRSIEVLDHAKFGGPEKTDFGVPGSLIVFVARDEEHLGQAKSALKGGKAAIQQMVAGIDKQMNALQPRSIDDVAAGVAKSPAFGALSYAGATIADPVFLPDGLDLTVFIAPYAGGRLVRQGFTFVEYVEQPATAGLALFVLKSEPKLTAAEKSALELIPRSAALLEVGSSYECEYTTLMAAAFGVAGAIVGRAAGAVVGAVAGAIVDVALVHAVASAATAVKPEHLTSEELKRLGPEQSAKQLVNLRLQALQAIKSARA